MTLTEKQKKYISDALEYNAGTQTLDQVIAGLESGQFQLWSSENAAAITELARFPNKTVVNIALGGGELTEIQQIVRDIEAAAKSSGLTTVSIIGRRGWGRTLPGYREQATVYMKEL